MSAKSGAAKQLDMACTGVVLAVDTARISGWAVRHGVALKWSGQLDTLDTDAVDAAVRCALTVSGRDKPVLVLERPWGGQMAVLIALGQARERWLAAWARARLSRGRVVSAWPQTWRPRVLGRGIRGIGRERLAEREMLSARAECRPELQLGADEATAILISRWAVRDSKVAAMHRSKRA
jgi:hypothetical protein